jgi:hypothetical protein
MVYLNMEEDMIQLDLSQYDELDLLTTEGLYLNELTALWAHVEANDISPMEVESFTWRNAYMTEAEILTNTRALQLGGHLVYTARSHFNAIRLTNDDVVPLPVIAKPVIPDSMPVTVKEIV